MEDIKLEAMELLALKTVKATLNIKDDAPIGKVEDKLKVIVSLNRQDNFIDFLEKNENRAGLEYKTGYQKFLTLEKEYKDRVIKQMLLSRMGEVEKKAYAIAERIKKISPTYEDNEAKRITGRVNNKQLTFRSFKGAFSDDTITLLEKVGTLGKCIELQKSVSGSDALKDKLFEILKLKEVQSVRKVFLPNSNIKAIDSKNKGDIKRVHALIEKATA